LRSAKRISYNHEIPTHENRGIEAPGSSHRNPSGHLPYNCNSLEPEEFVPLSDTEFQDEGLHIFNDTNRLLANPNE